MIEALLWATVATLWLPVFGLSVAFTWTIVKDIFFSPGRK